MPKKILIVDDEAPICNVLRKYFSDLGYTVFVSGEAGEALAILNMEKPQILILDIRMLGLDGIETLRLVKEINKDIKVIMLTAIKDEFIIKEATQLGASTYITKPFSLEDLKKAVEKL